MNKQDIKVWSTLYNSNDILCLCYKITKEKIYLISYNPSVYPIINNQDEMPAYRPASVSPIEFFKNFKRDNIGMDIRMYFDNIFTLYQNEYLKQEQTKNKLLLILN